MVSKLTVATVLFPVSQPPHSPGLTTRGRPDVLEAPLQEEFISIIIAKHPGKPGFKILKFLGCDRGDEVSCVEDQADFLTVKQFYSFGNQRHIIMAISYNTEFQLNLLLNEITLCIRLLC